MMPSKLKPVSSLNIVQDRKEGLSACGCRNHRSCSSRVVLWALAWTCCSYRYRSTPSILLNGQCIMQVKNSMYCFWDVQQHHSGYNLPVLMPRLSFLF